MIDTVVLIIPKDKYRVHDTLGFEPTFYPFDTNDSRQREVFLLEHKGFRRYKKNPKPSLREQGLVYPNLHIDERLADEVYTRDLKVSFSCPKILWGHSFNQITDQYSQVLLETLRDRLDEMGVEVTIETLKSAVVHTLHFCVNIMFRSEEEARMFLNRLNKVSLPSWFENNTKIFSNNGHAARFHTNIFEIVFYLKYYDVLQPDSQSQGRRKTRQERDIAKKAIKDGIIPPLMRFEIRFNGVRPIKTHLKSSLGIDKENWTFQEVLDFDISRKTLKHYWNQIVNDLINRVILSTTSDEDICLKVLDKYPGVTLKNIAESLGLFYLIKNLGHKAAKEIAVLRQNRKAWYDKRSKVISFLEEFANQDESLINIVTKALEDEPIQLDLPEFKEL